MFTNLKYYKYRSLENWHFLLDIFLNQRLYAARSAVAARREQWNICSLTPHARSSLMWAYYANGHRGIAIGVELGRVKRGDIRRKVDYDSHVYVRPEEARRSLDDVATTILFRKQLLWGHEDEFRVLTRRQAVAVKIVEVHLGAMIADADRERVVALVRLAVPSARILRVSRGELK
jgi:hypothetical protein